MLFRSGVPTAEGDDDDASRVDEVAEERLPGSRDGHRVRRREALHLGEHEDVDGRREARGEERAVAEQIGRASCRERV